MKNGSVLILGARSDIGIAIAYRFASEGYSLQLAARNADTLDLVRSDIQLRHDVIVTLHEFDALTVERHKTFISGLPELPIIAITTIGLMTDQIKAQTETTTATLIMRSNYEGPASILAELANHFEKRGSGTLVGISSVAGERGRASNYVYGSAKAGFTAFLSGLRNRLHPKGVHVLTVIPGFVNTNMTSAMTLPKRLTTSPLRIAIAIRKAINNNTNVLIFRPIWKLIVPIIKALPEKLFKRTNL